MDAETRLSDLPLFEGVAEELIARPRRREYRTDQRIVRAGSPPDRLVVVIRGMVEIRRDNVLLVPRLAPLLIGEQSFLESMPHSADVIARGAVITFEFSARQAIALLADPTFMRNLAKELSWKLRLTTLENAIRYRSEEMLLGAFGVYTSSELAAELLSSGVDGTPRRTNAAILFSDIRGFTRRSAEMSPDDVAREVTSFLDLGVEVVFGHSGIVDKFIGDAIMAIWSYPEDANHAEAAVRAAIELAERSAGLRFGGEPLEIGIGVESGNVVLGSFGGAGKRQFTALGDSVNRAARLESETKNVHRKIVIGPNAFAALPPELAGTFDSLGVRTLPGLAPTEVWGRD
jgi:class 3 adenylate cyclase